MIAYTRRGMDACVSVCVGRGIHAHQDTAPPPLRNSTIDTVKSYGRTQIFPTEYIHYGTYNLIVTTGMGRKHDEHKNGKIRRGGWGGARTKQDCVAASRGYRHI